MEFVSQHVHACYMEQVSGQKKTYKQGASTLPLLRVKNISIYIVLMISKMLACLHLHVMCGKVNCIYMYTAYL